ncbi:MAG: glycosyltransferase [Candidatus Andersenbacteria bacterium]
MSVTGIPINVGFAQQPDHAAVRRQFGLPTDNQPVVLITRGTKGYDARFTLQVLAALAQAHLPITIVANAGRNPALVARMREVLQHADPAQTRHVFGWIDNMHELLAVTDVLVAKPGGLTLAEALARGVPMLAFRPIPGQEDANVAFLERHRIGQLVRTPGEAAAAVRHLVDSQAALTTMKARAAALGFSDGAYRAARQVLADLAER